MTMTSELGLAMGSLAVLSENHELHARIYEAQLKRVREHVARAYSGELAPIDALRLINATVGLEEDWTP